MFKFLKDRKKDNKGFTLVELMVCSCYPGNLGGIHAPQYTKYVEKSRRSADIANMDEIVKAVQVYAVDRETSKDTADISGLKIVLGTDGVTCSNATVKTGIETYVPDMEKIKVKSSQWTSDPTATFTITKDGGVTVDYTPADFATAAERKTTSNSSTSTPAGN